MNQSLRILSQRSPSISFEFFPPKSDKGAENLFQVIKDLESCRPSFVSVTYGAGGTTRDLTHQLVLRILEQTTIPPVPHLTCVSHQENEIRGILTQYAEAGVDTILALRGDPPSGDLHYDRGRDAFQYAGDLVRFIREFNRSGGHPRQGFGIGVAGFPEGHPETQNRILELDYLRAKVDAGADYICTQLFFDNHDFFDFRERCDLAGIKVPIIAGIMPMTTAKGMKRMAELAAGARYPARLLKRLKGVADDPARFEAAGIQYATEQCQELIDNEVDGIHFYTLNKSTATLEIARRLNLA